MFDGAVVDLILAEHFQRLNQLLAKYWIVFQDAQCLGCRFKGAQTTLGRLGANDVIAGAGRD